MIKIANDKAGLLHAMTASERKRAVDLLARMEQTAKEWRQLDDDMDAYIAGLEKHRDTAVGMLPGAVRRHLARTLDQFVPRNRPIEIDGQPASKKVARAARQVRALVEIGFFTAVVRYRKWLVGNREVEEILHGRDAGQRKGHATQSQNSADRAQRIRDKWAEMEAAGEKVTNSVVAAAVGCSISTVIRAFQSKPTRRKNR